ncbi:MAG: hypothetical protein IPJ48_11145 [Propionivibrio sp.]|uniref:Uncharacterized protein n=1 Tax=Candidatus Propionivibrio dominans TaxID=2954373 RepID=A0A9D7FEH1_9RHOO|nr:hypothetical protein [Candidatus Propionivibrio dominans]
MGKTVRGIGRGAGGLDLLTNRGSSLTLPTWRPALLSGALNACGARYEILLYDLTSTFLNAIRPNRQTPLGYSRDHRPDWCRW